MQEVAHAGHALRSAVGALPTEGAAVPSFGESCHGGGGSLPSLLAVCALSSDLLLSQLARKRFVWSSVFKCAEHSHTRTRTHTQAPQRMLLALPGS